ncbi:unnamed protein product [Lepidochelys olivacea]
MQMPGLCVISITAQWATGCHAGRDPWAGWPLSETQLQSLCLPSQQESFHGPGGKGALSLPQPGAERWLSKLAGGGSEVSYSSCPPGLSFVPVLALLDGACFSRHLLGVLYVLHNSITKENHRGQPHMPSVKAPSFPG